MKQTDLLITDSYKIPHNGTPDVISEDGAFIDLKTVSVHVESRVIPTKWSVTYGEPIIMFSYHLYKRMELATKITNVIFRLKRTKPTIENYLNTYEKLN